MKNFKFDLNAKVAIYVPSTTDVDVPTGFYLDDVILGPAKQPTEGKVFADFAENNELEFYENDICVRHR